MFYNYLKIIYDIIKNYSLDSDEFKKMLFINESFIRHFKKRQNLVQIGGRLVHILEVEHERKSKILNCLNKKQQGGGTDSTNTKKLEQITTNIIDIIHQNYATTAESIGKLNEMFNKLTERLNKLHDSIPNDKDIETLENQLKEIKEINDKYL